MNQQKKVALKLTSDQQKKLDELTTVSEKIRYLDKQNYARADISRIMSQHLNKYVRYQWVKNVLDAEQFKKK